MDILQKMNPAALYRVRCTLFFNVVSTAVFLLAPPIDFLFLSFFAPRATSSPASFDYDTRRQKSTDQSKPRTGSFDQSHAEGGGRQLAGKQEGKEFCRETLCVARCCVCDIFCNFYSR